MFLSIIIVHHKTTELLKLCLNSIEKNLIYKNNESEVIVVDSETETKTEDLVVEKYPWVKYLPLKKNVGYAAGVNCGLKTAVGEYLAILNPDIIITPDSLEKILKYLKENPEVGLLGPKLLNFNGKPQNSCFRFYKPTTIAYRRTFLGKTHFGKKELASFNLSDLNKQEIIFPDWLMGSAMFTKREAVNKVGLMDERFKLYFEDVDWARRFWENGYKVVFFPKATMLHYHIRKSKAGFDFLDMFLRREARWHITSAVKYFLKHGIK